MRKPLAVALVAVLGLLLTSALTPSAPTQSNERISCVIDIQVVCPNNDIDCTDGHWEGPITGCILQGMTIQFWETERNFLPGRTEHFFEDFYIRDGDQTVISGHNAGVWNFSTFKFRANGSVVDATGPWAYLQGYRFHEMGRTSDPNLWDPPGTTVTGFGTVMTLH
jgi:hypothetical protein